jgi:hypothetical protein
MRGKLFLAAVAVVASLLMGVGSGHAIVIIDNFDFTTQHVDKAAPGPDTAATAAGEAIGDFRTIELTSVVGALSASLDTNPGGVQLLALSNDVGVSSEALVTWDAGGAGLGGVDLTQGGASPFLSLDIVSIDQGNVDLLITITDVAAAGGDSATWSAIGLGVGVKQRQLALFTNAINVDFTQVDKITLEITADVASDLSLDSIFTSGQIPEPSTVVLLGIGILGVLGVSYRRRKNS